MTALVDLIRIALANLIRIELVEFDQDCTSRSDSTALIYDRNALADLIRTAVVGLIPFG
jgi:hypothetical protein